MRFKKKLFGEKIVDAFICEKLDLLNGERGFLELFSEFRSFYCFYC